MIHKVNAVIFVIFVIFVLCKCCEINAGPRTSHPPQPPSRRPQHGRGGQSAGSPAERGAHPHSTDEPESVWSTVMRRAKYGVDWSITFGYKWVRAARPAGGVDERAPPGRSLQRETAAVVQSRLAGVFNAAD